MGDDIKSKEVKGPRIRLINIASAVLAIIIAVLFIISSKQLDLAYEDESEATRKYVSCQMAANTLKQSSDNLTTQVRLYTITQDAEYLNAYFDEVATSNREQAVDTLEYYLSDSDADDYLQDALRCSNELMEREYYAFALVLDATNGTIKPGMEALSTVTLSAEDQALSDSDKINLAINLTHDEVYQRYDVTIDEDVAHCVESVLNDQEAAQLNSNKTLNKMRIYQIICAVFLVIAIIMQSIMTMIYIIRPIDESVDKLASDEPLPLSGAYEIEYLQHAYNTMYKQRQEQKELEAMRIKAEAQSRAKTTFLFNMSHDIRTPMNAIVGYTNLALRDETSKDEMRDFLKKIDTSSQHLLALINDVLEMSRIESGKMELEPEACDLVTTMDEVRDMFDTQMREKDIIYTVETDDIKDRYVVCDKNRLNRVLLNLISNAYKFTPKKGSVSVSLSQIDGDDTSGRYELRVKDSGIGMSPEFATRVFDAFERERTSTVSGIQGTGLGMAITKRIVDIMGGTITVDTKKGEGTQFIIELTLPLSEEIDTNNESDDDKHNGLDFSNIHLLLVEDQEINREIATMILTEAGFTLDTAENGKVAVEMVEKSNPGDYDAILMDIQMPVMGGYEATSAIRALDNPELASIPIIAMTANAFAEDIKSAKEAGMNAHIAKPIDVAAMLATLTEVINS